ncbi:hypothetical protein J7E81_09050 [Bacillus sp. ISL-18]|uniref:hypothetical protein n=1 Tax=Bacillus sp. ISL-18 TaxID=2819118 RepID=UPI001BEC9DB1|nr:hypothetical protein [Bacillus sp. ISL-18]MBT2655383.1 hypothetical protein [Bacillus sp. ISL-18]
MEQVRIYRISLLPILGFICFGLLWCLLFILALKEGISFAYMISLIFPFTFIGYGIYLWRKRKEGKGFYWDDEGIVIDLKGNRVYWKEIESIKYSKGRSGTSTVIYPHYTNHEKIRIRRNKWMPTTAYSIAWILIESPNEFHENLIQTWEEKSNLKK